MTSNIVFQKIGTWSYSIYLWHWPLVVIIYTFALPEYYIYLGMALSILLGFLSYKYVEKINFPRSFPTLLGYLKCKPIYIAGIVGVLGSLTFIKNGIDSRFELSAQENEVMSQLVMPYRSNGYCFYSSHEKTFEVSESKGVECYLGDKESKANTLLFGDSYAGHNEPFFDEVFKANKSAFQSVVTNWCTPSLSDDFAGPKTDLAYEQCMLNRKYLIENLGSYKNIIFSGMWTSIKTDKQINDMEKIISEASELGVNVIIMAAPKSYSKNPLESFKKSIYLDIPAVIDDNDSNDLAMREANMKMAEIANKYDNVHFIDRTYLYDKSNNFKVNGLTVPYSYDGGHLSILGSKYSAKYFMAHSEYDRLISYFDF